MQYLGEAAEARQRTEQVHAGQGLHQSSHLYKMHSLNAENPNRQLADSTICSTRAWRRK